MILLTTACILNFVVSKYSL